MTNIADRCEHGHPFGFNVPSCPGCAEGRLLHVATALEEMRHHAASDAGREMLEGDAAFLRDVARMLRTRANVYDTPKERAFAAYFWDMWLHFVVWPSLLAFAVGLLVGRFV